MVYHSLDATFAALADPTRRAILSQLVPGELSVSELAANFPMTLPAVRKHVRTLERAGLVRVRRQGRVRRARLTAAPMRQALSWIERYRAFWEFQFDELEKFFAGHAASGGAHPRPPFDQAASTRASKRAPKRRTGRRANA